MDPRGSCRPGRLWPADSRDSAGCRAAAAATVRAAQSLPFAFFVFAVVQVLNNSVPYLAVSVLHQPPVPGNPLASTVSGTVLIQLLETVLAVVPIIVLIRAAGGDRKSLYLRAGTAGAGLAIAIIVCALCYVAAATGASAHLFPVREAYPLHRFLALTPVLLVVCLSNGFQEELLFRGLFLQRYRAVFGKHTSNLLQATIFTYCARRNHLHTDGHHLCCRVRVSARPDHRLPHAHHERNSGAGHPARRYRHPDLRCISELRIHLMN